MNSQCKHKNLPFHFVHFLFSLASWKNVPLWFSLTAASEVLLLIVPNSSWLVYLYKTDTQHNNSIFK